MLGGDNMDLALAHLAETRLQAAAAAGAAAGVTDLASAGAKTARLSPGQHSQLVDRCRAAKERLLALDAPVGTRVTLLGAGARLVGAARSVELSRDEVTRIVVDGFFPLVSANELPRRQASNALVGFGLPYASDPAVTRHIAAFLQQHAGAGWPDALLLNGGVFRAAAISTRLQATLAAWRGAALQLLHNTDPDLAVARGAVAYALARRGLAPRIGGGSPRSYFLLIDGAAATAANAAAGRTLRGVCVLPHGSEEGHEIRLEGRRFVLRVGEPVRFHLVSTTAGTSGVTSTSAGTAGQPLPVPGELVDLNDRDSQPLPPLATVVRALKTALAPGRAARRDIPVQLAALLTEVGTLELHCIAEDDPALRWKLEFQLRADPAGAALERTAMPPRWDEALACIEHVFGARKRQIGAPTVKQLRPQLEALLGSRQRWPTAVLRPMFDALWQRARGRRRSVDHERLWLSLAGWCLRPGFGDALDGWRIEQLWPIFEQGVQHGHASQVNAEWWTLWRRVAGGLDEAAQRRLLDDFAINLRGGEAGPNEHSEHSEHPAEPDASKGSDHPLRPVAGGWDDMVRLGASLERIPVDHKVEIGDWLLERLRQPAAAGKLPKQLPKQPAKPESWTLWAIGRIGARTPLYGSAHGVVPIAVASIWLTALLALDWKRTEGAAAAAASLARLSGDRARDLPLETRECVSARLAACKAPSSWIARLRNVVPLDEAGERGVFGEALPPGLTLIA